MRIKLAHRMTVAVFVLLFAACDPGLHVSFAAQSTAQAFVLDGQVRKPGKFTQSELQALRATSVTVSFLTEHG
jgi:hypothetical protein